ncbi:hypothetical protein EDD22DRAFT_845643 [Suillus occidentalis]|nr:hypothetical protein EDD22DRAFT_845643 [Suillus occidentalis]
MDPLTSVLSLAEIALISSLLLCISAGRLITDCIYCGSTVTLTICVSDDNGNKGKPMARHPLCALFHWYPQLVSRLLLMVLLPPPKTHHGYHFHGFDVPEEDILIADNDAPFKFPLKQDVSNDVLENEELHLALNASLLELSLPLPGAADPIPSLYDIMLALPPNTFVPELPSTLRPYTLSLSPALHAPTLKPPQITQQMDPVWTADLHAHAQQEAEEQRVKLYCKEMEREVKQHFVLHWYVLETMPEGCIRKEGLGLSLYTVSLTRIHTSEQTRNVGRYRSVHRMVVDVWISNWMMDRGSRANPTDGWEVGFRIWDMIDDAPVLVEWVFKCPYYPQWQLTDNPELIALLGENMWKIEVYKDCSNHWIQAGLSHTFSLESGCNIFSCHFGVLHCRDFQELLNISRQGTRPCHL